MPHKHTSPEYKGMSSSERRFRELILKLEAGHFPLKPEQVESIREILGPDYFSEEEKN